MSRKLKDLLAAWFGCVVLMLLTAPVWAGAFAVRHFFDGTAMFVYYGAICVGAIALSIRYRRRDDADDDEDDRDDGGREVL